MSEVRVGVEVGLGVLVAGARNTCTHVYASA